MIPGTTTPASEVDSSEDSIEHLLDGIRSLKARLEWLEEELRSVDTERTAASEHVGQLRWRLRKAEQENARLHDLVESAPVDPSAYAEAQTQIAMLQREVEVYQYSRSLATQERTHRWLFWRR